MDERKLPEGWEVKTLGDITTKIGSGATPRGGKASYKTTGISLIRSMNVHDFEFREKNLAFIDDNQAKALSNVSLEQNDVLFNITGASIARCCVVPDSYLPARVNQHVSIIRAKKEIILPSLLNLLLTSTYYKKQLLATGEKGATRQALTKVQLESFEIKFPKLLSEQKRIVSILDKAFTEIEKMKSKAQQNLKNAKELFESYLQGVFENRGEGWEEKLLGDILAQPPRNGWSPPAKNQSETGIPVLTLSAVTGFIFKSQSIKYTSAQYNLDAHYWVKNGDLLITRSNTPELVGHVAICDNLTGKTIYPDLIMKINPNQSKVITEFLYYLLRSPKLRDVIIKTAHGANPTMKKINQQDVRNLPISFPSLHVQRVLIDNVKVIVDKLKKLEKVYEKKIADLEELKKSILQKGFEGEL